MTDYIGLCNRCEHRQKYREAGYAPRCECKDLENESVSCYMPRPVAPIVMAPEANDPRPLYGPPLFAARMRGRRIADHNDLKPYIREVRDGIVVLYGLESDIQRIFSPRWYQLPNAALRSILEALRRVKWRIRNRWERLLEDLFDYFDPMGGLTV